jgi:hypothetical protein
MHAAPQPQKGKMARAVPSAANASEIDQGVFVALRQKRLPDQGCAE